MVFTINLKIETHFDNLFGFLNNKIILHQLGSLALPGYAARPPKEQYLNFAWPQCINPLLNKYSQIKRWDSFFICLGMPTKILTYWMILEISMYSGDLKSRHVRISNGVWFSNSPDHSKTVTSCLRILSSALSYSHSSHLSSSLISSKKDSLDFSCLFSKTSDVNCVK